MKRSEIFWGVVFITFVVWMNLFFTISEEKMRQIGDYGAGLIMLIIILFDLILILLFLGWAIPKFNNWLDNL